MMIMMVKDVPGRSQEFFKDVSGTSRGCLFVPLTSLWDVHCRPHGTDDFDFILDVPSSLEDVPVPTGSETKNSKRINLKT